MTENSQTAWRELFPRVEPETLVTIQLRVLQRRGAPFLYLPTRNRAAAQALDLYPAQTWKARLFKKFLQLGFRFSLLTHGGGQSFSLPCPNMFLTYLARAAGQAAGALPEFAVLAGNPHAPGRRFVFLVFNAIGQPGGVVKAGCSARARELITQEIAILREYGGKIAGIPVLREEFVTGNTLAFATDFITGYSPKGAGGVELEKLFTAWLDSSRKVAVGDTPAWQRLRHACHDHPLPEPVSQLAGMPVCPTLMHGDLAPWNIKVAAGRWTVLDWERGERVGLPVWDWLHFVLQPAVLVERAPVAEMMSRLEQLFATAEFGRYANRAGVADLEWPLAAAYVSYCLRVTQQTEGSAGLESLLQELHRRAALTKP